MWLWLSGYSGCQAESQVFRRKGVCVIVGGIAFLLLILFRAAVMSSPLAQAGLTNAGFIFFLGKKKKERRKWENKFL